MSKLFTIVCFWLLSFCLSLTYVYTDATNDLIINYFHHKKVSSVIGYSCNSGINDALLLKSLNQNGINAALNKLISVSMIKSFGKADYYKLGIVFDTRCCNITCMNSMFLEAANGSMYDELHSWLIIGYDLDAIANQIDDRTFGISTDFVIAIASKNNEDYSLYDAFNVAKNNGGTLNITFLGDWSEKSKLDVYFTQSKLSRRSDLNGLVFRIAFFKTVYKPLNMTPEDYFQIYTTTGKDGLPKFGFSLLSHLSELFNFRLNCSIKPKWEVGDLKGPLVHSLMNNEADIAGSGMIMDVRRTHWIKFIFPIWPVRTCFIFRSPPSTDIKIHEVLRPFDDYVWHLMIIFSGSATVVLAFVAQFEWTESTQIRLSQSFILMIGAICQQGTNVQMTWISTRIAFFSIMIFGLLIYNYYSTLVVSARFNEPIMKINDSLSELAKLPLNLASEYIPFFPYYIKREDWETKVFYEKRWAPLPESKRFIPLEEGLQLMKNGGFAYHTYPDVAYPFIHKHFNHRELCEITEVHLIRPTYASFSVQRNSTIVELMKYGIAKLLEGGLRLRQVKRWKYKMLFCQKNILTASSIEINEFAPHLLLLVIGMFSSLIICLMEIILFKLHNEVRYN